MTSSSALCHVEMLDWLISSVLSPHICHVQFHLSEYNFYATAKLTTALTYDHKNHDIFVNWRNFSNYSASQDRVPDSGVSLIRT